MLLSLEEAYFSLAALLLLSIATIGLCKSETRQPESYAEFLYTGKTLLHSIVSSAGAVFSVTYLLGAVIIYATIYRAWTFVMAGGVAVASLVVISRIVRLASAELPPERLEARDRNLLLSFMENRLSRSNYETFTQILSLAFLLLLVEELAISRLVLQSLIPGIGLMSSVLLFIIVAVIFSYIYIGGFRALLNSDLVQGVVLVAFLLVLLFFVSGAQGSVLTLAKGARVSGSELLLGNFFWMIYGTSFFIMSVDLFARMNFKVPKDTAVRMRQSFVGISMLLLFVIVSIGILFGLALSPDLGEFQTASGYYTSIVTFFTTSDAVQVKIIFLVALFCMIFTTIDTLLLAVMQIGFCQPGIGSRRDDISTILVLAVAISVFVDSDAVCAFGIFVGSILILPCSQVLPELYPIFPFARIKRHQYLWVSLASATLAFVVSYDALAQNFTYHYLIPAMVVLSLFVGLALWGLLERLRPNENQNRF